MVVLGGEKYGLNISMTRIVSYGKPDKEIAARMKKTQYIFCIYAEYDGRWNGI